MLARARGGRRARTSTPSRELIIDGKTMELPVVIGTENERAIDIANLRAKTGLVTLDPAFMNTASTKSAITFLDGEKGILRYRGIPIEQLGRAVDLRRDRPTCSSTATCRASDELARASPTLLTRHSLIHEDMKHFFDGYPVDRPSDGDALVDGAARSRASTPRRSTSNNTEQIDITIARLLSKVRTIAAFSYKKSIGQPFVYPQNSLSLLRELPQHDVLGPGRAVR